jgi:class 3 adenylate cyclase/tetratricopeptide (TPR) repeat protein
MTSAESRLQSLFERLLTAAETSLAAGDLEQARATAEEIIAVDPDNERAGQILRSVASRQTSPAGERALVSILFSDLVGSTMISEKVEPEQLRDLLTSYRAEARKAVERYNGSILQYAGDGILAVFGRPRPHEDDARRAVLAGLDLVAAVRAEQAEMEREVGVAADVRVGIHTGRVVVADLRGDASVPDRDSIIGVAPNLAARIQSEAEPGSVVISDVTQQLVDADFYLDSLGVRELKGISRPVEIFAVEGPRYAGGRFEAERYRKGGLVGRDGPRMQLYRAWERLSADGDDAGGATFLIAGEAGIGKTRLAADLLAKVESSGGRILAAACFPYYSNVSLWPMGRMLERGIGVTPDDEDRVGALEGHLSDLGLDLDATIPFLAPLIGASDERYPPPELDPSAFLDETLNRLVDWLAAMAATSPHLLVVEDLHWADPSTLGLLGRLIERHARALLTVATTREPEAVPWVGAVDVLALERLDAGEAASVIDNLLADLPDLDDELRSWIVERAEGIPLFLEELTQSCLEEDRGEPMPLRLQETFTWRLKAPGVDLRVPQVAATLGPAFDAGIVAAVIGDETLVEEQLSIMTEQGIVERGDLDQNTYRFRHALLRDAAYETQVLDVRTSTHAQVADVLADRGAEAALIAEHLDLAGQAERAIPMYMQAAQAEQGRGANSETTRLLTRALQLLDTVPESDERDLTELTGRMLRGLSVSSMQGYAAPEVQADHRRAEALATRLGTRPEVLPSLIAIWAYWLTSGDLGTARVLIERLQDLVSQPAYSWFEPEVEGSAGWLDFYQGKVVDARRHLEHAVEGFTARPPDELVSPFWPLPNDPIAVSYIALACVSITQGDTAAAHKWEIEAIRRAEEIGFPRGPFSLAFVKTYAAWIRRFIGDHAAARLLGAEVAGIGQAYGYVYWVTLGSSYLTTPEPSGQPDPAFLSEIIGALRLMGQEAFAASNLTYLAELEDESGNTERAKELIEEAIEVVHKTGENLHLASLLRRRAQYGLALGRPAGDAVADLTEAVRVSTEQGARVERLRGAIAIARLDEDLRPARWREWLEEALVDLPEDSTMAEVDEAASLAAG